jgi:cell wall-associated NlpC family hydrolase
MFLVDCAVTNRRPIALLEAIVSDPKHLRETLNNTRGTGYASGFPPNPNGVSGTSALPGLLSPNAVLGSSVAGAAAIAWARAQIGKPYRWGATGPDAYDCSGLVQQAYAHAGINLPRTTAQMIFVGKRVSKADLVPGDLVFPDPGHVQIYTGGGNVIESPHTGLKVREVKMWGFMTARRVVSDVKVSAPSKSSSQIQHDAKGPTFGGSSGFADIFGGNG